MWIASSGPEAGLARFRRGKIDGRAERAAYLPGHCRTGDGPAKHLPKFWPRIAHHRTRTVRTCHADRSQKRKPHRTFRASCAVLPACNALIGLTIQQGSCEGQGLTLDTEREGRGLYRLAQGCQRAAEKDFSGSSAHGWQRLPGQENGSVHDAPGDDAQPGDVAGEVG